MKKIFLLAMVIATLAIPSTSLFAQYNETIRTGRPGEAIGPFAVGARVFQIQAGLGILDYKLYGNSPESTPPSENGTAFLIGSVFRMGLTEHFEVNMGLAFQDGSQTVGTSTSDRNGMNAFAFGIRYNIYVGKGWIPSVGFQVNVGMPWLSPEFNSSAVRPRMTLITAQRMAEKWGLTTNWGLFWNGDSPDPLGYYVVNVSYDASDKWSVFIEPFGFIRNGYWEPHIDGGAAYLVNNNLQLDIAGGIGMGPDEFSDWFVNAGVSWRVRFKEKSEKL